MNHQNQAKPQVRRYYVEVENVILPAHLSGLKAFEASTTQELLNKIVEYYGFKWQYKASLQLWSNKRGLIRERLDELEQIPDRYEFIYVRGVTKDVNNNDKS